jgi:hypothetical protein
MTQPNQYTERVTLVRTVATASVTLRFEIQEGTAPDMVQPMPSRDITFQPTQVLMGFTKTPASKTPEWIPSTATVSGPRRMADGSLSAKTAGECKFGHWSGLDLEGDELPRWLVMAIVANMPTFNPIQPVNVLEVETSWEDSTYGA